nr:immunoglobulin heavy chain junction region [Homo sapiens]
GPIHHLQRQRQELPV